MKSKRIACTLITIIGILSIANLNLNIQNISSDIEETSLDIDTLRSSSVSGGGYIMNTSATFSWIEINETGNLMLDLSNQYVNFETIYFPTWEFSFYETLYDRVHVSYMGWMSFPGTNSFSSPVDIPRYEEQNHDFVALFMDYLKTNETIGGSGGIYYQFLTVPTNMLVIEYHNVSTGDYMPYDWVGSFEVIFYESGNIKFQYLNVENSYYDPVPVGLDHGDCLNYNSYTGFDQISLPVSELAIEFTFDQMTEANYSLSPEENDEISWIVTHVEDAQMTEVFGTSWEQSFGLPSNPTRGQKIKINVTSVDENSTYMEINYDLWDWNDRLDAFPSTAIGSDTLIYRKKPRDYEGGQNLTNLFPLVVPGFSYLYLLETNLSSFYSHIQYVLGYSRYDSTGTIELSDLGEIVYYQEKNISGETVNLYGSIRYTSEGLLDQLHFSYYSPSKSRTVRIFNMEFITPRHLVNYTMNVDIDEELSWIVTYFDNDSLSSFYGPNWGQNLGFPSNPTKNGVKNKIKITSILDNSSYQGIDYSIWDWINRTGDYSAIPPTSSSSLVYRKDPFDYMDYHNLSAKIPFITPNNADLYSWFGLFDNPHQDFTGLNDVKLVFEDYKVIGNDSIWLNFEMEYDVNGILQELTCIRDNFSSYYSREIILKMEFATPILLANTSLGFDVGDEYSWIILDLENDRLESLLGSDWEQYFGLGQNPTELSKMKINFTSIAENSTHWAINYSIWDCIPRNDSFTSLPSQEHSVDYLIEPFDYEMHNFTTLAPLFLPSPPELYTRSDQLGPIYNSYWVSTSEPALFFKLSFGTEEYIYGRAYYNNLGFLKSLELEYENSSMSYGASGPFDDSQETVLKMVSYFDGPKPSYVGVNEGDVYEYDIEFYPSDYYPGAPTKIRSTIDFINGEDPAEESVLVLIHQEQYLNNSWQPMFLSIYGSEIYILKNYSKMDEPILFSFLVSNNIDWDAFVARCEALISNPNVNITAIENGYIVEGENYMGLHEYYESTYTPEGILLLYNYTYNRTIGYSFQLNISSLNPPVLEILYPLDSQVFTTDIVNFTVLISNYSPGTTWYTLNGGDPIYFSGVEGINNGTIDVSNWTALENGEVVIRFYALDANGSLGQDEVTIIKSIDQTLVNIYYPFDSQVFTTDIVNFTVLISNYSPGTTWYTLNGGDPIYFSGVEGINNGTIDVSNWTALENGEVVIRFYALDANGSLGQDEVTINKNTNPPIVEIYYPLGDEIFRTNIVNYTVVISNYSPGTTWYTLNGGDPIYFSGVEGINNGAIDVGNWTALENGEVTIRFYALDESLSIGQDEVTVYKSIKSDTSIPGFDMFIILGFFGLVSIGFIVLLKKRILYRSY